MHIISSYRTKYILKKTVISDKTGIELYSYLVKVSCSEGHLLKWGWFPPSFKNRAYNFISFREAKERADKINSRPKLHVEKDEIVKVERVWQCT